MKRLIALLLVVCMLGVTLVACSFKKDDPKVTQKPTETETATNMWGEPDLGVDVNDKWAGVTFGGEELTILVLNDEKVSREWETEDPGADELDQQIQIRNELAQSNLELTVNIQLTGTCNPGDEWGLWNDNFTPGIINDVDNKLHDLDVVANFGFSGMNAVLRDYYVNLHDKDTLPYFDFSLACWNQDIVENGTLNGRLYLIAGDMNLSLFNASMIMWHNMDLYDKVKNVENGDPEDIQDLVLSGYWTYAELYKWSGYYENSGDNDSCTSVYGVYIGGDPYPTQPNDAIPHAWDVSFFTRNDDGSFSYNIIGNEKAEKAKADLRKLHDREGNLHFNPNCSCGNHFINGGTIFNANVLYWTRSDSAALREMEDKYALIPWPKYDEEQLHYTTTSQDYFTTMSVLDHSGSPVTTKGEAVSAYLQYTNEYSYDNVRGYYFHKIVKSKMFGTDDSDGHVTKSWNIFCEIVDNLQFDFGTIYGQMLEHVLGQIWRTNINTDTTIQAKYEGMQDVFDEKLYDLNVWFDLIEE